MVDLALVQTAGAVATATAGTGGAAARPAAAVALVRYALAAGLPALDEWRSKQLLAAYGVPAVAAADRLIAGRAGASLEGVLVEEMLDGNREFLVGLKRDPVFGPVVAFGLGGVLTEVLGDVALAVPPLSARDVAELPDLIRASRRQSRRGTP